MAYEVLFIAILRKAERRMIPDSTNLGCGKKRLRIRSKAGKESNYELEFGRTEPLHMAEEPSMAELLV